MVTFNASELAEFERVAGTITERAAELLRTRIRVTNDRGVVVASSDPSLVGHLMPAPTNGAQTSDIRVPWHLDARAGEVLVDESAAGATIPPHLAQALVDLVINQIAVVDRLPHQPELRNKFIYDLLQGTSESEADVLREAKLLDLDLTPPRAVILIDASNFVKSNGSAQAERSVAEVRRRSQLIVASVVGFFHLPADTICAECHDGEIAVLKASDSRNLANWVDRNDGAEPVGASWSNLVALKRAGRALLTRLRHDTGTTINVGIGRYHSGIKGLARSYTDARAALSLGRRFHGQNRVHCLDELGTAAFVGLADERTKLELAAHLLSPLDHEPELLRTLRTFFTHNCCPSATAHQLGIHRNTLGYRLDKIASMTGLDPRRFEQSAQIYLALVLRSLDSAAD